MGIYQVISTTKRALQQKSFGSTVLVLIFLSITLYRESTRNIFIHAIIHQTVVPSAVRNTY